MEYIYVRQTHIEFVTPEWAEGRAHSVLHVNWVAYPAESDEAQRWLQLMDTLQKTMPRLVAAYEQEFQRWQEMQRLAENARQLVAEFNLQDWNYSE